ncbi:MAG: hypothetical protein U0840_02595 [Gemmataceae bacterium]
MSEAVKGTGKFLVIGVGLVLMVVTGVTLAVHLLGGTVRSADRRRDVMKAAVANFVDGQYGGARPWPTRVEEILPGEVEGQAVDPSKYRLAPAKDLSRARGTVAVLYEVEGPRDQIYVGFADGTVRRTTKRVLSSVLGEKVPEEQDPEKADE